MRTMESVVAPGLMTLEEYLHTSFRPDCDFVDGEVEQRNMEDTLHSLLRMEGAFWFRSRSAEWKIRVMPELRTRVGESRVRIPDVTVAYDDAATVERVRLTPADCDRDPVSGGSAAPGAGAAGGFLGDGDQQCVAAGPSREGGVYLRAGLKRVEGTRIEVDGTAIYMDLE